MFGIILQLIGSFLDEASQSIGKDSVQKNLEDAWTLGFLNAFMSLIGLLIIITFIRGWDHMTFSAWPTFLVRVILLLIQSVTTVIALVQSERSTFGFLRVGTIPIILLIDVVLGVVLSGWQVLGMMCIAGTVLILSLNHGLSKKGLGYLLYSTVSAAIQLSLLRYNVTHGNSVELEQFGVMLLVAPMFYVLAVRAGHPGPLKKLKHKPIALQSGMQGISMIIGSYSFLYAPASILLATARGAGVMTAVLAGHWYFHEKRFLLKLFGFIGCAAGIILLSIGV
jgi:hypothetical protein